MRAASPPRGSGGGWRSGVLFAVSPLVVGMSDAWVSLRFGEAPTAVPPSGWAPAWVFPIVWLVLYPTLGLAAWSVWRLRAHQDVAGVLALFATYFVGNLFFMPMSGAVGGKPMVLTMMDLNGLLATAILAWASARASRRALSFLLPTLVWMPITFALKIWLTVAHR